MANHGCNVWTRSARCIAIQRSEGKGVVFLFSASPQAIFWCRPLVPSPCAISVCHPLATPTGHLHVPSPRHLHEPSPRAISSCHLFVQNPASQCQAGLLHAIKLLRSQKWPLVKAGEETIGKTSLWAVRASRAVVFGGGPMLRSSWKRSMSVPTQRWITNQT